MDKEKVNANEIKNEEVKQKVNVIEVEEDVEEIIEVNENVVELPLSLQKVKTKSNKIYNNYVVTGSVIGANGGKHEGKARLVPKDNGGYAILDLIFDGLKEVPLRCVPFRTKLDDGKVIEGYKYFAYSLDAETGEVCTEIELKCFQPSDKDWLNIFINQKK